MKSKNVPRKNYCLNCEAHINADQSYCPQCGQENKMSILSIRSIIVDFFSNTFYFDSKIWKSFYNLFFPGRTTKIYVAGKRKSYLHPFRVFFVSAILFFALFNSLATKVLNKFVGNKNMFEETYEKIQSYDRRSYLLDSLELKNDTILKERINFVTQLYPEGSMNPEARRDTLFQIGSLVNLGSISKDTLRKNIENRDFYELTPDEIIAKYNIQGWYKKMNLKQSIRMAKNIGSSISYIMNNFIWGVFFVIGICAFFLKLLYIRHDISYVEMLLLLFELHAVSFFLATIGISIQYFQKSNNFNVTINTIGAISFIYLMFSLKNYFKQNFIKTFFKTLVFYFIYLIMLLLFVGIITVVSMIMF